MLISLLLTASQLAAASVPSDPQAAMEELLQEQGLTGAVWSLVSPAGNRVGAAGLADADSGDAMSTDNRVHIGSVSKTVLATGVLRLITTGKLSLDTRLSELLPELRLDNPWAASDPVRIRHLLAHTAGLDNLRFWQAFSLRPGSDTPLLEAFSGDPTLLRLRTRPGSTYSYSNMGYGLLGLVIESVTGERYESYLDKHLLQALSMGDSSFEFVSQRGSHADDRLAMGHFENGRTQVAVNTYLRPAGQFTTTAGDMAVFAEFLMGSGLLGDEVFIAPDLMQSLDRAEGTESALAGLQMGHGLALARRDRHGVVGMCHPGTVVGFRAMMCLYPEQKKAFFVAMNTDSETADYNRFDALLIQALGLENNAIQPTPATTPDNLADWSGFYIPAPNNMQQFAWVDMVFNFIRLDWNGSRLVMKSLQSSARELIPAGEGLLRAADRTVTSHVLFETTAGARIISDGLHHYEQSSLTHLLPHWTSLVAGMLGLGWILLAGLVRALTGRLGGASVMMIPFIAVCALMLPVPLFFLQSGLQVGDLTLASASLALVTGALPLGMTLGIIGHIRKKPAGMACLLDAMACLAVLQWTVVLMAANLLPFRLWA